MKFAIVLLFTSALAWAQPDLPYYEMPPASDAYTAGAVASRMVDGLGFRFYWATEALRTEDLSFKPGEHSRTTLQTIEHIYEMSIILKNATTQTINTSTQNVPLPFSEMRKAILENLKTASDILRSSKDDQLISYTLKIKRGEQVTEYPFWNQLNGPVADCLWHVGQIVSLRRLSGNPFSEKVNVFSGTVAK
jgi:hypothetical protein